MCKPDCKHEVLDLIEKDEDEAWLRCAECFVVFKFTKAEFDKLEEIHDQELRDLMRLKDVPEKKE